jgi:hypothetical protein
MAKHILAVSKSSDVAVYAAERPEDVKGELTEI